MGYRGELAKQDEARALRSRGWTLAEIAEEVGCSRSSASLWCRNVVIDEAALAARRQRSASRNEGPRQRGPNKLQRRKQAEIADADERGRQEIGELDDRDLLVAAVALYAGEGAKSDGCVKLANSDPRMIRLFLRWLRSSFTIDESRLRINLYLHDGLDLGAAVRFWSRETGIPPSQFTKPYRAAPNASIRSSKHPMGCATVTYSCAATHRRIMGLVRALLS